MSLLDFLVVAEDDKIAFRKYKHILESVLQRIDFYRLESGKENLLRAHRKLKNEIQKNYDLETCLPEAFAIFSELAFYVYGFRPNVTQIFGAVVLSKGEILNMRTGEGKTLTAEMVAYLQGLTGEGIHIITTNDYLAERDHAIARMLLDEVNISCGLIIQKTPRKARKSEYAKDVTYIANQEIGFDYLRDNQVKKFDDKVLRGFPFAIIDEVDSILIDEARTSMIISSPEPPGDKNVIHGILGAAKILEIGEDFEADLQNKTIALTEAGTKRLINALGRDIYKKNENAVIHQVILALYALVFLKKDQDYIIIDKRIILIDEFTGHKMPDRRLLDGLHQAVEAKEGLPLSDENAISGTITYHSLFKKYKKFTGMSGTALGAKDDFSLIYNLSVVDVNPYRDTLRTDTPTLFFRLEEEKFAYIRNEIKKAHDLHMPVLVIGRSIQGVKKFSYVLQEWGMEHTMLTAELTEREFEIIKLAGKPDVITVATNMAGRGADIILEKDFREQGGLVVFGLEPNLSRRVDTQLRGRTGRRGNPGMSRLFASLEDEIFQVYSDLPFWKYVEKINWEKNGVLDEKLDAYLKKAQLLAEALSAETREISVGFDDITDTHRNFFYGARDVLLRSEHPLQTMIAIIRQIFFREDAHVVSGILKGAVRSRLMDFLTDRKLILKNREQSYEYVETILDLVFYKSTERLPVLSGELLLFEGSESESLRDKALYYMDSLWVSYLSEVYYLQNAVFIQGAANDNPLSVFTAQCDKAFHAMRDVFALETFGEIYARLVHFAETKD